MELLTNFKENFKKKKLGIIIFSIFFILLIFILLLGNYHPKIYAQILEISVYLILTIFVLSQYFDLDFKFIILSALILISICPFLLIFKLDMLANHFAYYVYGFLIIGIVAHFFDNLRKKLKNKGYFKIYKIVFLSIFICFLIILSFHFYKDYQIQKYYTILIKNNFISILEVLKDKYIYTFKKEIYYSKKDKTLIENIMKKEDIIICIETPCSENNISRSIKIKGWAIEGNSKENSGIDKIDFFIDGKPGEGKNLGRVNQIIIQGNQLTEDYIINLYYHFFNRNPERSEFNYWVILLEYRILTYREVSATIANSDEFNNRNLSNEDFVNILFEGLLNRKADTESYKYFVYLLNSGGSDRYSIIYTFLNSDEFGTLSDNYYKIIPKHDENLSIIRKDIGDKYGNQFILSGFELNFDSTRYSNGEHIIYVYAHSPIFGWDYKTLKINIEN